VVDCVDIDLCEIAYLLVVLRVLLGHWLFWIDGFSSTYDFLEFCLAAVAEVTTLDGWMQASD
jgi:hypothetical protein